MNKFISSIVTTQGALASRATQMSNLAENSLKALGIKLDSDISALDMERAQLLDFAPDTTDSLRPGAGKGGKFNSDEWAARLVKLNYDERELKIQRGIVTSLIDELFTDEDAADGGAANPAEIHD